MSDTKQDIFKAIDHDSGGTTAEEVVGRLREMIHRGELKSGDRLPPERDLARAARRFASDASGGHSNAFRRRRFKIETRCGNFRRRSRRLARARQQSFASARFSARIFFRRNV